MPNMFDGDQFHPAYCPQTKLEENQVMIGTDLYTVLDHSVQLEKVDGSIHYLRIDGVHLPDEVHQKVHEMKLNGTGKVPPSAPETAAIDPTPSRTAWSVSWPESEPPTLEDIQGKYIQFVLEQVDGNKSKAARILGMGRRTLYRHLETRKGGVGHER